MRETVTMKNPGGWKHVWSRWISPEGVVYREARKKETPDLIIIPGIPDVVPLRLRVPGRYDFKRGD